MSIENNIKKLTVSEKLRQTSEAREDYYRRSLGFKKQYAEVTASLAAIKKREAALAEMNAVLAEIDAATTSKDLENTRLSAVLDELNDENTRLRLLLKKYGIQFNP